MFFTIRVLKKKALFNGLIKISKDNNSNSDLNIPNNLESFTYKIWISSDVLDFSLENLIFPSANKEDCLKRIIDGYKYLDNLPNSEYAHTKK